MRPQLLRPDNFTPLTRTPWGGQRILARYKAGLGLQGRPPAVGESWEISVEPSFPSRLAQTDETLGAVLAQAPAAWLGPELAARFGGQTPLLVKLLDAAQDLSVQVHPADGDPRLGDGESGKPESWLVLEADAGSGIYLGFRDGVDRAEVERCIAGQGPLDELLNFVPVRSGDGFVIAAGTPHAIGRGVTLVEPQFVAPGRRGVTYRFWDWNRRYDARGKLDPRGQPRPLHLERSLDATDWEGSVGTSCVARSSSALATLEPGPIRRRLLVDWEWFVAEEWSGSGTLKLPAAGTMWGLCCVGGRATVSAGDGAIDIRCGQSCVVPAQAGSLELRGRELWMVATRCR